MLLWPFPSFKINYSLSAVLTLFQRMSCCCCYCCYVASVVSDSVRPYRRQPTRLCCPWDSPGKNTGVGCHFLLQCMKVKSESEVAQSCPTLCDPVDCSPPGSSAHGIFQARVLEWGAIAFSREWVDCCVKKPPKIEYTDKDRIILITCMYHMGVNAVALKNGS